MRYHSKRTLSNTWNNPNGWMEEEDKEEKKIGGNERTDAMSTNHGKEWNNWKNKPTKTSTPTVEKSNK